MKITFSRWPWQEKNTFPPYDTGDKWGWKITGLWGRFGGGWNWKLGISASRRTIIVDLIFGSIRISRGGKS